MTQIELDLLDGYTITEEIEAMTIEDAENILLTEQQGHYCAAIREGCCAKLHKHTIQCPFCGHTVPIGKVHRPAPEKEVPPFRIHEWSDTQTSLFLLGEPEQLLKLAGPTDYKGLYSCEKCGFNSPPLELSWRTTVRSWANMITITCKIVSIEYLMRISWVDALELKSAFPLYESVTFNSRNGHTYLELRNDTDELMIVRDITFASDKWTGGPVYEAVAKYSCVKDLLTAYFQRFWDKGVEFPEIGIGISRFVEFNMFLGFPPSFYEAIPYICGTRTMDRHMKHRSRLLHKYDHLPALYEKSDGLPNCKSVRWLFFTQPALFFYAKECEMLYGFLQDPNRFCILIQKKGFWLLSTLYSYPLIKEVIRDIVTSHGSTCLYRHLMKGTYDFLGGCIQYIALNDELKQKYLEQLLGNNKGTCFGAFGWTSYSFPAIIPERRCSENIVRGFSFRQLRSANEYTLAGTALKNCLEGDMATHLVVYVVRKNERIVAAISVDGNHILQALCQNNWPLQTVPGLEQAVEEWASANKIMMVARDEDAF